MSGAGPRPVSLLSDAGWCQWPRLSPGPVTLFVSEVRERRPEGQQEEQGSVSGDSGAQGKVQGAETQAQGKL